jgi:hypothetical protein
MENKKQKIDIVNEVLEACILAYPLSSFIISLYKQYQERGSLSKKQLQGLYAKAAKIPDLAPGKLGTLEAVIKRMPTRYKSDLPSPQPVYEKEESVGQMIAEILQKYPEHKRALFLKSKYDSNTPLTPAELADLERFRKLILK